MSITADRLGRCAQITGVDGCIGSAAALKRIVSSTANQPLSDAIRSSLILDSYTESGVIIWFVFAPTNDVDRGALQGKYVGVTAEATLGAGLGANVLIGGGNSIALQPLSISGQQGLNIAGGIGAVTLTWAQ